MYSKNDVKEFIEMLEGSSLSVLEIKTVTVRLSVLKRQFLPLLPL